MHQDDSFELKKPCFFDNFLGIFTIRGDPFDLGGVKVPGNEKTWLKSKKKNCFQISMTKLTQKWVVEV